MQEHSPFNDSRVKFKSILRIKNPKINKHIGDTQLPCNLDSLLLSS